MRRTSPPTGQLARRRPAATGSRFSSLSRSLVRLVKEPWRQKVSDKRLDCGRRAWGCGRTHSLSDSLEMRAGRRCRVRCCAHCRSRRARDFDRPAGLRGLANPRRTAYRWPVRRGRHRALGDRRAHLSSQNLRCTRLKEDKGFVFHSAGCICALLDRAQVQSAMVLGGGFRVKRIALAQVPICGVMPYAALRQAAAQHSTTRSIRPLGQAVYLVGSLR